LQLFAHLWNEDVLLQVMNIVEQELDLQRLGVLLKELEEGLVNEAAA
jgi:hypothetical protein